MFGKKSNQFHIQAIHPVTSCRNEIGIRDAEMAQCAPLADVRQVDGKCRCGQKK